MEEKIYNKDISEENNKHVQSNNSIGGCENKMNVSNALLVIVAVLVIMSGVQVFQTQKLLNSISNGTINASTRTQGSSIGLPSQVGGCG